MSSWPRVLDAEWGTVFSSDIRMCSFRLTLLTLPISYMSAQTLWDAFSLSLPLVRCGWELFSSCVVVLDAVCSVWSKRGFSTSSSVYLWLAVASQRKSRNHLVPPPPRLRLCEDSSSRLISEGSSEVARGPLGKVLQKVKYPARFWVPEINPLTTDSF